MERLYLIMKTGKLNGREFMVVVKKVVSGHTMIRKEK